MARRLPEAVHILVLSTPDAPYMNAQRVFAKRRERDPVRYSAFTFHPERPY